MSARATDEDDAFWVTAFEYFDQTTPERVCKLAHELLRETATSVGDFDPDADPHGNVGVGPNMYMPRQAAHYAIARHPNPGVLVPRHMNAGDQMREGMMGLQPALDAAANANTAAEAQNEANELNALLNARVTIEYRRTSAVGQGAPPETGEEDIAVLTRRIDALVRRVKERTDG